MYSVFNMASTHECIHHAQPITAIYIVDDQKFDMELQIAEINLSVSADHVKQERSGRCIKLLLQHSASHLK
jgi:hypothetical protein